MDEKRPPSETSEDTESGDGSERRRRIYRRKKSRCDGRLWIFLVLGAVILVLGIVIGGLYFNIRTLTESTEFTEVTPTYVSAIAVLCSSLSVALLFWRRLTCLEGYGKKRSFVNGSRGTCFQCDLHTTTSYKPVVFLCVITCTVTAFLCGITAILTGTHVVRPIMHFTQCFYFRSMRECHCTSPYKRSMLELQYTPNDPVNTVFRDADSCDSIEEVLLHMLYALMGTYILSFLLTVGAAVLSLLVLRMEKIRMGLFEDDTYEEIFTVSNSSATPPSSDSDNEHQHMLHSALPSGDDGRIPESHIIHRSRSFSQPRFPASSDTAPEKSLPKITVSPPAAPEQQGKLKEHRRRNRRAVTLHNMDTHQLMVILSLQMRYLQENENAKSQTTLNAQQLSQQLRRALTPQPNHERPNQGLTNDIRQVRSHTPQPYHFKNRSSYVDQTVPDYENMFDPSEFIRQMKQEKAQNANKVPAERELCPRTTAPVQRPKTPRQGYTAQTIPPPQTSRKGNKTPVRLNYYEEIDDMADCLDDSSASDQIYENQSECRQAVPRRKRGQGEGQVVPGHMTCEGASAQRDITNILPALYPSIPRHLFDRSQTPTRPKSYLNAVDPSDSPQVSRKDQVHNSRQHNQNLHQTTSHGRTNTPCQESSQPTNSGAQSTDIYAMPVRNQHPPAKPARTQNIDWSANQQQPSLPGQSEVRSAFHAVPRSKKPKATQQWNIPSDPAVARLQVSARSFDGNVGEFNMQGQSNHVSNVSAFFPPPPYSPPPSYTDVMTHSRDSSLHSLTSSTSNSDDVDFYQQIRKPSQQAQAAQSQNSQYQNLINPVLSQLWGNSSVRPESIPYNGPPNSQQTTQPSASKWNGQSYQNQNGQIRNHSVQKTPRQQEYENFDEPVRGPRQMERVLTRRDIPGIEAGACYGAMAEGNSSDSDCMETVI